MGLIWELGGGGWVNRQGVWWVDRNSVAVDGLIGSGFAGFDRFRLLGRSIWSVLFVGFDRLISCWIWWVWFFFFSHGFDSYGFGFIVLGWWVCWVSRTWIVMFWVWLMKNTKNGEEHEEQYTHMPSFHWNGEFKLISSAFQLGRVVHLFLRIVAWVPRSVKRKRSNVQLNAGSKHTLIFWKKYRKNKGKKMF